MIIEEIIDYTQNACQGEHNVFSRSFFDEHLALVAHYADKLSGILNADKEIVLISSYLHDISTVFDFKTISTHNIDSANIAESILKEKNYSVDRIALVKQTISKHTTPIPLGGGTKEEICVSNADAISQIVNPAYWFYFAFKIRNMSFHDGAVWYKNRIQSNWEGLIEPAKELISKRYKIVTESFSF